MPNRPDPTAPTRAGAHTIRALPAGLEALPWELPRVFLGLDGAPATPGGAATWILPVPYEATTSWGAGTRRGPRAIIDASRYIELYDHELGRDPSLEGVYTFPALELVRGDAARAMAELEDAFTKILDAAAPRRVITLGGEHSVSAPAILAHARRLPERLSVLQFDAHLDLRSSLDGSPYSHACAMGRVIDRVDLVTVGARGISREEWRIAEQRDNVTSSPPRKVGGWGWVDSALDGWAIRYITFACDLFDPALMPSRGRPSGWRGLADALALLGGSSRSGGRGGWRRARADTRLHARTSWWRSLV